MWKKKSAGRWNTGNPFPGRIKAAAARRALPMPVPEPVTAVSLKTEYRSNPLGIGSAAPCLSWICLGGKRQTAFQVICRNPFRKVVWDSGKRFSSAMHTPYLGPQLKSRDRIYWQVRLWNGEDIPGKWSAEAVFELGLLFWTDWKAHWISGNYIPGKGIRYPADLLRGTFEVDGTVRRARLYAAFCGSAGIRIGTVPVMENSFLYGFAANGSRVPSFTFDITGFLLRGKNEITVSLSEGTDRGSASAAPFIKPVPEERKCLVQIEIEYTDNRRQTVCSDALWKWCNDGPFRETSPEGGEVVEAYRSPSFSGRARLISHDAVPAAAFEPFLREGKPLSPVIRTASDGLLLLDFGEVITGFLEFSADAEERQRMVWYFGTESGESSAGLPALPDFSGNPSSGTREGETGRSAHAVSPKEMNTLPSRLIQETEKRTSLPVRGAGSLASRLFPILKNGKAAAGKPVSQILEYHCRDGENHYRTAFSVYTFRYVKLEASILPDPEKIRAIPLLLCQEQTGFLSGPDSTLLRLERQALRESGQWKTLLAALSRDQKTDPEVMLRFLNGTAVFTDCRQVLHAFLGHICGMQKKDGSFPPFLQKPKGTAFRMPGGTGEVYIVIRMLLLLGREYGDKAALRRYYAPIRAGAEWIRGRCGKKGLFSRHQRMPDHTAEFLFADSAAGTAAAAECFGKMAELAAAAGEPEDRALYGNASEGCLEAVREIRQESGSPKMPENSLSAAEQYAHLLTHACGIRVSGERRFLIAPEPAGEEALQGRFESVYGSVESGWHTEGDTLVFRFRIPPDCSAGILLPSGASAAAGPGVTEIRQPASETVSSSLKEAERGAD